jgi:hypothetical protein
MAFSFPYLITVVDWIDIILATVFLEAKPLQIALDISKARIDPINGRRQVQREILGSPIEVQCDEHVEVIEVFAPLEELVAFHNPLGLSLR